MKYSYLPQLSQGNESFDQMSNDDKMDHILEYCHLFEFQELPQFNMPNIGIHFILYSLLLPSL